jgi:hypothetical protein
VHMLKVAARLALLLRSSAALLWQEEARWRQ